MGDEEVAAIPLVGISKKKQNEVIQEMMHWADDSNPYVRRAANEGLRDASRRDPESCDLLSRGLCEYAEKCQQEEP